MNIQQMIVQLTLFMLFLLCYGVSFLSLNGKMLINGNKFKNLVVHLMHGFNIKIFFRREILTEKHQTLQVRFNSFYQFTKKCISL